MPNLNALAIASLPLSLLLLLAPMFPSSAEKSAARVEAVTPHAVTVHAELKVDPDTDPRRL